MLINSLDSWPQVSRDLSGSAYEAGCGSLPSWQSLFQEQALGRGSLPHSGFQFPCM